MLASPANSTQLWRIGQYWPCYLAWPFHALFAWISCNKFLESLKHTGQSYVVIMDGVWNFIRIDLRALCRVLWLYSDYNSYLLGLSQPSPLPPLCFEFNFRQKVFSNLVKLYAFLFPVTCYLRPSQSSFFFHSSFTLSLGINFVKFVTISISLCF